MEVLLIFQALAKQSYDLLKNQTSFLKITNNILKRLKKIQSPVRRARLIHNEVEKAIESTLSDPLISSLISCKKGCSACCHTQVSITSDEVALLGEKILSGEVEINIEKLYRQAQSKNSAANFFQLKYETRGCVFLNDKQECSIYEDRPSVCRTNNVLSDPSLCSTADGKERSVRIIKTQKANMMIIGAFMSSKENGALPYMLANYLDEKLSIKRTNPTDLQL